MTSPSERIIREGFEHTAPRTPQDFVKCWKESQEYQDLIRAIDDYNEAHPFEGQDLEKFALSRKAEKSSKQRENSPYTLSYWRQIKLCMWRETQRLKNDPSVPIAMLIINAFEALIIASLFVNLQTVTSSFFSRGVLLFMIVMLSKFCAIPCYYKSGY